MVSPLPWVFSDSLAGDLISLTRPAPASVRALGKNTATLRLSVLPFKPGSSMLPLVHRCRPRVIHYQSRILVAAPQVVHVLLYHWCRFRLVGTAPGYQSCRQIIGAASAQPSLSITLPDHLCSAVGLVIPWNKDTFVLDSMGCV